MSGGRQAVLTIKSPPESSEPKSVGYRNVPLRWFVQNIRAREPIALTRWGDGEWSCVIPALVGSRRHNTDRHRFFPELGEELRTLLLARPGYLLGMAPHVLSKFGEQIRSFLAQHELEELDWIDARPFHRASMDGRLDPFIHAIARAPLIVVGPAHLGSIARALGAAAFIETPPEDCYLQLDRIHAQTELALRDMPRGTFVSVSAGMTANVLIHRLHDAFGGRHLLVDIGSLWDPYAGVLSRNYMRRLGPLNLPETEDLGAPQ